MNGDILYDGTSLPPEGDVPQNPGSATPGLEVPAGSPEDRLAWVSAGEDQQTRYDRATAVYDHERDSGGSPEELSALSASLTAAVYGTPQPGEETAASGSGTGTTPDAAPPEQPETIASAAPEQGTPIEGQLVQSETAGTGEAVNAETGETTAPGDPLPPIQQQDGEPLADVPAEGTSPSSN